MIDLWDIRPYFPSLPSVSNMVQWLTILIKRDHQQLVVFVRPFHVAILAFFDPKIISIHDSQVRTVYLRGEGVLSPMSPTVRFLEHMPNSQKFP